MRKHGWQLPYHPLQVVANAVFLALGFAFYVFFAPFLGEKLYEYVAMGLYTPLVSGVFFLYIWCTGIDPGDPGVFKSKKYHNIAKKSKCNNSKASESNNLRENAGSTISLGGKASPVEKDNPSHRGFLLSVVLFGWCPPYISRWFCLCDESSKHQCNEDGMFYCNLCKTEVFKYSKHCRACDKCVDCFDHHCRWLNNCVGKRNYRPFFMLMVTALLLLILQWSTGVMVLVRCFIKRKNFNAYIALKLGSSFSFVPFVFVVASCTILGLVASVPLAQLFLFHVMLIKKGISTYDYVTALRDQEQLDTGVQQSPQMSPLSSPTRLSSTSSFNIVNRGTWCTPPRLFVENQFDVIPPQMGTSKKILGENQYLKRNTGKVKLNPWTLARLDAEEISKSAAQARMKSRTLRPIVRQAIVANQDADNRFDGQSDWLASRIDCQRHGATMSCGLLPDFPHGSMVSSSIADNGSEISLETPHLAPLQLEARTAFRRSCVVSPVIGLHSPELHLFRLPSCGSEEAHGISSFASSSIPVINSVKEDGLSSDGYEASGGEDSDLILPRIGDRTLNRTGMLFESAVSDMENNRLSWSWASSSTGLWGNDGARF